jgi:hypothetical protein
MMILYAHASSLPAISVILCRNLTRCFSESVHPIFLDSRRFRLKPTRTRILEFHQGLKTQHVRDK